MWLGRGTIAALLFLAVAIAQCAPKNAPETSFDDEWEERYLEVTCEKNLSYLDRLIQERSVSERIPAALIVEAKEIFRLAESLYLEKEYILALELIDDAIKMLDGSGK